MVNRNLSTYLDFLRIFAAATVLFGHFSHERFTGSSLSILKGYEHDAVVVFFVLSGYVISSAVFSKNYSPFVYFTGRLGRIYSVLLPAMLLTILADQIGLYFNSEVYTGGYQDSHPVIRILMTLFFLNESSIGSVRYFSNGPIWSISYEVMYYLLFGIFIYAKSTFRIILLVLVGVIAGPRILLLLPVWFIGVSLHRLERIMNFKTCWWVLLYLGSIFGYIVYQDFFKLYIPKFDLGYSSQFINDYIVGFFVAINILSFAKLAIKLPKFSCRVEKFSQTVSSYTFSLYLFHFPLLLCFTSIFNHETESLRSQLVLLSSTLITIWLLARVTEHKKDFFNKHIRNFCLRVMNLFKSTVISNIRW